MIEPIPFLLVLGLSVATLGLGVTLIRVVLVARREKRRLVASIRTSSEECCVAEMRLYDILRWLGGKLPSPRTEGDVIAIVFNLLERTLSEKKKAEADVEALVHLKRANDALAASVAGYERFVMDLSNAATIIRRNPVETVDFAEILERMDAAEISGSLHDLPELGFTRDLKGPLADLPESMTHLNVDPLPDIDDKPTPPMVFRNESPEGDDAEDVQAGDSIIEHHIKRVRRGGRGPFRARVPQIDELDSEF